MIMAELRKIVMKRLKSATTLQEGERVTGPDCQVEDFDLCEARKNNFKVLGNVRFAYCDNCERYNRLKAEAAGAKPHTGAGQPLKAERKCMVCGKSYTPKRTVDYDYLKFCSPECRDTFLHSDIRVSADGEKACVEDKSTSCIVDNAIDFYTAKLEETRKQIADLQVAIPLYENFLSTLNTIKRSENKL